MTYSDLTPKKNELNKLRPFPEETAKSLEKWIELELTCAGNSFDDISFTRRETAMILQQDQVVPGHSLKEHIQTLNYAKAFALVSDLSSKTDRSIDDNDVKAIHGVIVRGLDDENAGIYRGGSRFFKGTGQELPDPSRIYRMMNDFGMWLYTARTLHPVSMAAEAHLRLMSVQPFSSGNARTARMLMNFFLLRNDYPPALFTRREKKEYWSTLEKAVFQNEREEYDKLIYRAVNRALDVYLKAYKEKTIELEGDEPEPYFLRIGQLAKEAGEKVSTIRYWTSKGLLETVGKTSADYMLYSSDVLKRIKKLKTLKEERYTLEEIREKLKEDE